MISLVADSDEAAPRDASALEVKPQLGMDMARHFGPRVAAHRFVAEDDPGDLDLVGELAAAMIGEAGIVVADDPGPVEAARQIGQQCAGVGRQPIAAEAVVEAVAQAIEALRAGPLDRSGQRVSVACES